MLCRSANYTSLHIHCQHVASACVRIPIMSSAPRFLHTCMYMYVGFWMLCISERVYSWCNASLVRSHQARVVTNVGSKVTQPMDWVEAWLFYTAEHTKSASGVCQPGKSSKYDYTKVTDEGHGQNVQDLHSSQC